MLHVNAGAYFEFTVCSAIVIRFFPFAAGRGEKTSSSPLSSDAGLLPIRQFDERIIRLSLAVRCSLEDRRHPKFIEQSLLSMVRQRI